MCVACADGGDHARDRGLGTLLKGLVSGEGGNLEGNRGMRLCKVSSLYQSKYLVGRIHLAGRASVTH